VWHYDTFAAAKAEFTGRTDTQSLHAEVVADVRVVVRAILDIAGPEWVDHSITAAHRARSAQCGDLRVGQERVDYQGRVHVIDLPVQDDHDEAAVSKRVLRQRFWAHLPNGPITALRCAAPSTRCSARRR
jgi:hypothetical protein